MLGDIESMGVIVIEGERIPHNYSTALAMALHNTYGTYTFLEQRPYKPLEPCLE